MVAGRAKKYNDSLDMLEQLEKEGKAFILRPGEGMKLENNESDVERLKEYYRHGYEVSEEKKEELRDFLREQ